MCKIVITKCIFLVISLNMCYGPSQEPSFTCVMGLQKNRLIDNDTVLLSTHNICLVKKKEKYFSIIDDYALLSEGLGWSKIQINNAVYH